MSSGKWQPFCFSLNVLKQGLGLTAARLILAYSQASLIIISQPVEFPVCLFLIISMDGAAPL